MDRPVASADGFRISPPENVDCIDIQNWPKWIWRFEIVLGCVAMTRGRRTKLEPWIEQVILSYGTDPKEEKKNTLMKAHVVGVGRMSESQARQTEGLTTLLFLSDGVVHIPAILTQDAWETLQEQEDRECFSSLINCTVCVYSYTLQFNMDSEQVRVSDPMILVLVVLWSWRDSSCSLFFTIHILFYSKCVLIYSDKEPVLLIGW
uniref:Shelterin complex subunit TPP1/Est3 domain-containing protein n=2 Tax=Hucho hucho TaxID=62062 RepID=A0A4W5M808_9TELE